MNSWAQKWFGFGLCASLLACSGGVQGPGSGGSLDGPAGNANLSALGSANQAAPMQVSGTAAPNYDPWEGECSFYTLKLEGGFESPVEDPNGQEAIRIKGLLNNDGHYPQEAKFLKVVDWRSRSFVLTPLTGDPQNQDVSSFDTLFDVAPISAQTLEETPRDKILSFWITFEAQAADGAGATQKCETSNCGWGQDWHCLRHVPGLEPKPTAAPSVATPPVPPAKKTPIRVPGNK